MPRLILCFLLLSLPALLAQTVPPSTRPTTAPTNPTTTSRPANQPARFSSLPDILAKTPPALQPTASPDWRKFTESDFIDWCQNQLVGLSFDQSLLFTPNVSNVSGRRSEWLLQGSFERKDFTSLGSQHTWTLRFPTQTVDQSAAKKWNAIKPDTRVRVKGTITSATFENFSVFRLPSYHIILTLKDFEIAQP